MALLTGNVWRVQTALSGWTGGPGLSTSYFAVADGDAAEAAEVVSGVRAFWDSLDVLFPTSMTVAVQPAAQIYDAVTGELIAEEVVTTPALITGADTTHELGPASSMIVLRLRSPEIVNGRRVQGRLFIGPVTTALSDNGRVEETSAESIALSYDTNCDTLAGGAVVWHRPVNSLGGGLARCSGYSVNAEFGVLRSRRD